MSKKITKLILDSTLMVLLLAILALPLTSVGWLSVKTPANQDVLPAHDVRSVQNPEVIEEYYYEQMKKDIGETTQSTSSFNDTNAPSEEEYHK